MYPLNTKQGLTIVEIITVVVVLSIIAAYVLPNFSKRLDKADERSMLINLKIIQAAQEIHKARKGAYITFDLDDLNEINIQLDLNLAMNAKVDYQSLNVGVGDSFLAQADHDNGWGIRYDGANPSLGFHCHTGGCPSCKDVDCRF